VVNTRKLTEFGETGCQVHPKVAEKVVQTTTFVPQCVNGPSPGWAKTARRLDSDSPQRSYG
jgi:hypothetical protein